MPFTYDPSQLATSALYQVRFEISDTDAADPLLDDDEISYAIATERNHWGAAARCAEALSRKFAQQADVQLGRNLRIEYSKRSKGYSDLADALRTKSNGTVLPWAGGTSISEKVNAEADSDTVQPLFTKSMFQNPRVGGSDSDPLEEVRTLP